MKSPAGAKPIWMAEITSEEIEYEKTQQFNKALSWHHLLRYKHILALFRKLAQEKREGALRVVDLGCAHAKLFSVLNERFGIDYTGIEIAADFVRIAQARYGRYPNFRIIHDSALHASAYFKNADIIVALEALEHIPEHDVVRIVEAIAQSRPRYFACSVPIEIGPSIWLKNLASATMGYVRHQEYLWRETLWAGLYQLDKLPPHDVRHKGFDWRWLAQTIRHNMQILAIRKLPFGFLPAPLAFSVFIIARPRD